MNKQEFRSHSSADMLIITDPTGNVISEGNAHMIHANLFSSQFSQEPIERDFVHTEYQGTSAIFTERYYLRLYAVSQIHSIALLSWSAPSSSFSRSFLRI